MGKSVKLAVLLNHLIKLLRDVEEHHGVALSELQVQHVLVSPLVRTIDLQRKPDLLLRELLLLYLLLLVSHLVISTGSQQLLAA
jgi:hypothetical protein